MSRHKHIVLTLALTAVVSLASSCRIAGPAEAGWLISHPVDDAEPPSCDIEFVGEDLTGNRRGQIAPATLQVVVFYDGHGTSPELHIEVGRQAWLKIGGEAPGGPIEPFGRRIETREYALYGCAPTGDVEIRGVVPNGVIDGLAFGVLWKDDSGHYAMLKSNHPADEASGADFVGMWPLGMSNRQLEDRTPQISTNSGREAARTIITGSALLGNGHYTIPRPRPS